MTASIRRSSLARALSTIFVALIAAVERMNKSLNPRDTIAKLQHYEFSRNDLMYVFHAALALFWVSLWPVPAIIKLLFPCVYSAALLVPLTSQILVPATPVLSWVIAFFSSPYIPVAYRPSISVSLLPTLESVLYGANISDILTRFTHPVLDILAWLPYGVLHFTLPIVISAFLWLFRPIEALRFWAKAYGYMNLIAVLTQIIFPCAPPWYELMYGLTPATYAVRGSAGGLIRIDDFFGSSGYQKTFATSPVVFGAFPSLHAGWATMEALFWSHFFPRLRPYAWTYAGILYWATMYLTHHYLIDVVSGACLATACFYLFLPTNLCGPNATRGPGSLSDVGIGSRSKHELYGLEAPRRTIGGLRGKGHARGLSGKGLRVAADLDTDDGESDGYGGVSDVEDQAITYRSPLPTSLPGAVTASSVPLQSGNGVLMMVMNGQARDGSRRAKSHRHTASLASLTHPDEDGRWSPAGIITPPVGTPLLSSTPSRMEAGEAGLVRNL